jgi:hypothetical protein
MFYLPQRGVVHRGATMTRRGSVALPESGVRTLHAPQQSGVWRRSISRMIVICATRIRAIEDSALTSCCSNVSVVRSMAVFIHATYQPGETETVSDTPNLQETPRFSPEWRKPLRRRHLPPPGRKKRVEHSPHRRLATLPTRRPGSPPAFLLWPAGGVSLGLSSRSGGCVRG